MQRRQVQRQANKHIKTKRTEATSQIATKPRSILTENRKQTTQNKQTITFFNSFRVLGMTKERHPEQS